MNLLAEEIAIHPTEATPRIRPLPMEAMRPEWLATLARIPGDGLKGSGFPRNVLGTIMRSGETFGPFLEFWVTCKSKMSLTVREQELVILRMACLYGSSYVWKHHVPVGAEFGICDAELDAIAAADLGAFATARERALLALTDELVNARTVRAEAWAEHAGALAERDLVDLVSLVAQYVFFALMNNAFQVQVEPPLENVRGF
ncbi:MAG: carboxymuconolactone decarboxylase family protein [Phycisphaerales bacterium]